LTEAWQRTRLFEALARAVLGSVPSGNAPSGNAPLLLFLDDLQWCDQETLDWLGYLLRSAPVAPLLLVATARKYEIDKVHPLMAFWLALSRFGLLDEILLPPLDATETGLLAADVAERAVDAHEAAWIYRDTEGNPLFVVETVRAAMADEETGTQAGERSDKESGHDVSLAAPLATPAALPTKARAVIQWRLAQLSPAAQALAQVAAVIGRKFSVDVLAQASLQDEARLVEGLDELWRRL
jgi:predicted ATPase